MIPKELFYQIFLYEFRFNLLGYFRLFYLNLKFVDLRTGKEIARYSFKIADPDDVQKKIIDVLESLPGA